MDQSQRWRQNFIRTILERIIPLLQLDAILEYAWEHIAQPDSRSPGLTP